MSSPILLKGGTVLTHDKHGKVVPKMADLLIQESLIEDIGQGLSCTGATVIDCAGKIVSLGFIDTHHHVWQTQLRGVHADETFLEYFPSGAFPQRGARTRQKLKLIVHRQLHEYVLFCRRCFLGPVGRLPRDD